MWGAVPVRGEDGGSEAFAGNTVVCWDVMMGMDLEII